MRRLLPVLALLLALAVPAKAAAACPDADVLPTAANLDRIAAATWCLHNEERAAQGLRPLGWSDQLARSAQAHALDMVERLFFAHTNLDGATPRDRIEATGYRPEWSGENIAWGAGGDYTSPLHTMAGWMESDGHRDNILREEFEHVGIGVAYGAPAALGPGFGAAATYVANFGSRSEPDDESIGGPPPPPLPDTDPVEPTPEGSDPQGSDPEGSDPAPQSGEDRRAERRKKLKRCLKRAKRTRAKRKRCKRRFR